MLPEQIDSTVVYTQHVEAGVARLFGNLQQRCVHLDRAGDVAAAHAVAAVIGGIETDLAAVALDQARACVRGQCCGDALARWQDRPGGGTSRDARDACVSLARYNATKSAVL